jgi:hypothetical protein
MSAHGALDASAIKMEEGFAGVAEQLSGVRGGMMDLVARLADLDRVLNGQRAQDRVMDIVGEAARSVKDALRAASSVAAPPRVTVASIAAQDAVAAIEAQTQMLDAVANLSLITARSLGLDVFDDYVRNLRSQGGEMRRDASRVGVAVAALRTRRKRACELFLNADQSLEEVNAALASHSRERADTARVLTAIIHGIGAVADRVPGLLAAETDALIQAMQFADAAAQRIDHIRTILSRGGKAELALAAAQIDALVAATLDTVSDARRSLSRINAISADSGRVISVESDRTVNPASCAVDLSRSFLTALVKASSGAFKAIDGAAGEGAALRFLAEEAAQRFASLADATDAIHIAAINAALLSRTENGKERVISVLSVDVQHQAAACARASAACRAAMAELTLANDLEVFASVSDKSQVFRRSIDETAEAISAAGAALAEMDSLRLAAAESMKALLPAINRAGEALGRIAATADDLDRLAAALPRIVPPGSGPLADLYNLYTMEVERAVHRRLFRYPEVTATQTYSARSAEAPVTGDDLVSDPLASILF